MISGVARRLGAAARQGLVARVSLLGARLCALLPPPPPPQLLSWDWETTWDPQPQLLGAGGDVVLEQSPPAVGGVLEELLDGLVLMGVPKSKVSPSRKRMKHLQHVPEPINWYKCSRCGEPKRPHRVCSTHVDICALSQEDYEARMGEAKSTVADASPKQ